MFMHSEYVHTDIHCRHTHTLIEPHKQSEINAHSHKFSRMSNSSVMYNNYIYICTVHMRHKEKRHRKYLKRYTN